MARLLNLGILAHVDAGKTTLTERLLYDAGVIDTIGSVDAGSTQTDTLALERQRGITIKSAVVSFTVGGTTVNLIDTPGHPDFIAEVDRVLGVLDGAVLVVSAVEGVQAQTRVLFRALRRLRLPTLLFVNKVDRRGADPERVLRSIRATLTPTAVSPSDERLVDVLSTQDDRLLAAYVRDGSVDSGRLRAALAAQTRRAVVHPVFSGSALTGLGVPALTDGLALLPGAGGDPDGPLSATVFKVERGPAGEKVAYARVFDGTVRVRDRIGGHKVTAVSGFPDGDTVPAGRIGKLWGLRDVRIGDPLGRPRGFRQHFARPMLETVVVPDRPADRNAVQVALTQLAEQDPLIDLRPPMQVSLYGEVQKEVLQATLADDYGLGVTFRESTTICVERPAGVGSAYEAMKSGDNPFLATVGLRVAPGRPGGGVEFRIGVELGAMPAAFFTAVEDTVRSALAEGLYGWEVIDCVVTMTRSGYAPRTSAAHQGFDKSTSSTGADFRGLTPLVLFAALREAGTVVHEPISRFSLEVPGDVLGALVPALGPLRAVPLATTARGLDGEIPAARVHELARMLPGLTRGEGVLETAFDHYAPVRGEPPTRSRSDADPLDRKEYLLRTTRRM